MEKADFTKQFAIRLRDTMIAAGHHSERSTSGVNIHKLTEMTGYSPQICRKYLRGQVLPEPNKLVELASKLQVSPGWLLFGEALPETGLEQPASITINKNLLHYLFTQARELYNARASMNDLPDFLLDLAKDVSQINASEEQSKKIIDLALSSARHFMLPASRT